MGLQSEGDTVYGKEAIVARSRRLMVTLYLQSESRVMDAAVNSLSMFYLVWDLSPWNGAVYILGRSSYLI